MEEIGSELGALVRRPEHTREDTNKRKKKRREEKRREEKRRRNSRIIRPRRRNQQYRRESSQHSQRVRQADQTIRQQASQQPACKPASWSRGSIVKHSTPSPPCPVKTCVVRTAEQLAQPSGHGRSSTSSTCLVRRDRFLLRRAQPGRPTRAACSTAGHT